MENAENSETINAENGETINAEKAEENDTLEQATLVDTTPQVTSSPAAMAGARFRRLPSAARKDKDDPPDGDDGGDGDDEDEEQTLLCPSIATQLEG